ncbi:MAG: acyl carrier protein [Lachnospiraceae bacterium]|nr:acyl carrier protein [Lachnospiraceae bacterium]
MLEEIIDILKEVHAEIDYMTEDKLIDKRIFDSFDVVNVVGELMDAFDVEITAEHMIPANFNSAQAICELVETLSED